MSGNEQTKAPRPVPVSRAPMVWDNPDPRDRTGPVPPAASVQARIDVERHRTTIRARLQVRTTLALAGAGLLTGLDTGLTAGAVHAPGLIVAGVLGVVLGVGAAGGWAWASGGPVVRELRALVRRETRVARSLAPLESAGWTVLHDRVVAAHRVPHIVIGPPGVVLVYDYLAGSWWRYQGRRAAAVLHSVLALVLTAPWVMVHRRGLPRLSAATPTTLVTPGGDAIRTAVWARGELAARLAHRPELDGWTVTVTSFYVMLNRPPDRVPETGGGVGAARC